MLSLALVCGGLAASEVAGRVREVEQRVGAPVPVVVATHDLAPDARLDPGDLGVRHVPARYVARDSLVDAAQAVGRHTAVALAEGTQLTEGSLSGGHGAAARAGRRGGALRRGERAVQVAVTGGEALGGSAGPGTRVDVLVSTEPRDGPGRSLLALEDVELLALRAAGEAAATPGSSRPESGSASGPTALATLRVTLRQAVYLTAAQNFARELRLLPRPAGDKGRSGRTAVEAGSL